MLTVIAGLVLVIYAGIAWVIVKAYRQTHNAGFPIIGCAVLLWPLVGDLLGRGMRAGMDRIGKGETTFFPFSLITSGQVTSGSMIAFSIYAYYAIHAGLLLIGLLAIAQSLKVAHASVSSGTER